MARQPRRSDRPARPLMGYRDVGEDVRHSRRAVLRGPGSSSR